MIKQIINTCLWIITIFIIWAICLGIYIDKNYDFLLIIILLIPSVCVVTIFTLWISNKCKNKKHIKNDSYYELHA